MRKIICSIFSILILGIFFYANAEEYTFKGELSYINNNNGVQVLEKL